ncbi:uncharacterized protein LOC119685765 [Teleopsis dalmanni]|uniref:uncharacterized protein LOC119685765 n=1 Tax=Teleopsis dalmanni TaxID=139649 RepID=UPI0018CE71D6|nr:uncharacterized protein LOC119685765 [Teleopsis dalmanni]
MSRRLSMFVNMVSRSFSKRSRNIPKAAVTEQRDLKENKPDYTYNKNGRDDNHKLNTENCASQQPYVHNIRMDDKYVQKNIAYEKHSSTATARSHKQKSSSTPELKQPIPQSSIAQKYYEAINQKQDLPKQYVSAQHDPEKKGQKSYTDKNHINTKRDYKAAVETYESKSNAGQSKEVKPPTKSSVTSNISINSEFLKKLIDQEARREEDQPVKTPKLKKRCRICE